MKKMLVAAFVALMVPAVAHAQPVDAGDSFFGALSYGITAGDDLQFLNSDFSDLAFGDFDVQARGMDFMAQPAVITAVPEPSSVALMMLGLGALGAAGYRRRRAS